MLNLEGHIALVTGGSRGIGAAICRKLAALGASVGVNYARDRDAANAVVLDIESAGSRAVPLQADLGDPAAAAGLVARVEEQLGPLDAVVVNHGIWRRSPIAEMTRAEWEATRSVNLDGAYSVLHAATPGMRTRGRGAVVLIASTAGQRGEAHYSHYAATKGALIAFTRSLAAELGPDGIRVNAVAPGWVSSDMTREVLEAPGADAELRRIPLGRFGTPEDIAGPVAFLLSDLASFVYGEILSVNGGSVMTD